MGTREKVGTQQERKNTIAALFAGGCSLSRHTALFLECGGSCDKIFSSQQCEHLKKVKRNISTFEVCEEHSQEEVFDPNNAEIGSSSPVEKYRPGGMENFII